MKHFLLLTKRLATEGRIHANCAPGVAAAEWEAAKNIYHTTTRLGRDMLTDQFSQTVKLITSCRFIPQSRN